MENTFQTVCVKILSRCNEFVGFIFKDICQKKNLEDAISAELRHRLAEHANYVPSLGVQSNPSITVTHGTGPKCP